MGLTQITKRMVNAFSNKGDLLSYTGSANVVLPLGTNTYVLTADSTQSSGLSWTAPSGGSSGPGGLKNLLINGNFLIWQRNTSWSLLSGNSTYTADRWKVTAGNIACNVGQGVVAGTSLMGVAPYSPFGLVFSQSSNATTTAAVIEQRIESVYTGAGQTVTLSWYAILDSGNSGWNVRLVQNFGGGGSTAVTTGPTSFTPTGTITRYSATFTLPSINGKTVGTTSNANPNGTDYLAVQFVAPLNSSTLELYGVQLEVNGSATPFEQREPVLDMALCSRYYAKTYDYLIYAADSSSIENSTLQAVAVAAAANGVVFPWRFPVYMRKRPAVTVYAVDGTPSNCSLVGTPATHVAATATNTGAGGTTIAASGIPVIGSLYECQAVADAEL